MITIRPVDKQTFYGFECSNKLYITSDGLVHHNSGKSVLEQAIVGHVSRYADRFQLVGIDCKRVEFNLLRGVKAVKGVALDVQSACNIIQAFQVIMMQRFKFMETQQVNNVYKIQNVPVAYYEIFGQTVQFDEMFELTIDLDTNDKNYKKNILIYPDGRIPKIMTIETIYEGLKKDEWSNPQLPEVKGFNSYIDKNSIRKVSGMYKPKALICLADEMNELMNTDDYRAIDIIKTNLGSIARLGRAAAVHLALACQRASNATIPTDLKNNIQLNCLLGGFDSGASTLMFEKDISNLAKPEIKGRGFIQSGKEIIETQTYYTKPERDWVFDETLKMTYSNPIFLDQKKDRGEKIDDNGFVEQYMLNVTKQPEDDDFDSMPTFKLGRRSAIEEPKTTKIKFKL